MILALNTGFKKRHRDSTRPADDTGDTPLCHPHLRDTLGTPSCQGGGEGVPGGRGREDLGSGRGAGEGVTTGGEPAWAEEGREGGRLGKETVHAQFR